jgi:hypothetical protein
MKQLVVYGWDGRSSRFYTLDQPADSEQVLLAATDCEFVVTPADSASMRDALYCKRGKGIMHRSMLSVVWNALKQDKASISSIGCGSSIAVWSTLRFACDPHFVLTHTTVTFHSDMP